MRKSTGGGLFYVCGHANDRIQILRKNGTFVKEFRVEPCADRVIEDERA